MKTSSLMYCVPFLTWEFDSQVRKTTQNGFTLIEVIIYLALYSILIAGALAAAYGLLESSAHNETAAMVEEEGDFLIGKIDWMIGSAQSIQQPAASGHILSVTHANGSVTGVWALGADMRIQENSSPIQTLNNSNVSVVHLNFVHTILAGGGLNPESISASFTLLATTSDGRVLSWDFYTLKYIGK